MRPLWKGAVSFGLVFVPVKMYAATEKKNIRFNYLHEKCKTPVQYKKYCPNCQQDVPSEEIVKGYQYEKGKFVVIRDEDLEDLPGETAKSINILDFVEINQIDPVYYDKPYYLVPSEGGEKVYELLRRAMADTGKVAIARVVIRSKESLACLRVSENTVMMSTMFYPDEVRSSDQLEELRYDVNLHENEVKMAVDLIDSLSGNFEPTKYTDQYREELMKLIQSKIAGEEVAQPAGTESEKVVDLMSALKASIENADKEKGTGKDSEGEAASK